MISQTERKKVIHCNLMSVFLAAGFNTKAAVVLHAPRSCSHIALDAFLSMKDHMRATGRKLTGNFDGSNLFVSNLDDRDTIFGGEGKLRRCLLDVIRWRKPEYVVVAAGCASSVIGDDVGAICDEVSKKTGVLVLQADGAGFMDQKATDGLLNVTRLLNQEFVLPYRKKYGVQANPEALTVLGANMLTLREEERLEIERIFSRFGFRRFYYPPVFMDRKALEETAGTGCVTVAGFLPHHLREQERYAAEFAGSLGVPFVAPGLPRTPELLFRWIRDIGQQLGQESVAEQLVSEDRQRLRTMLEDVRKRLQGRRCILGIGMPVRYFSGRQLVDMLRLAGCEVEKAILWKNLTSAEKEDIRKELAPVTDRFEEETETPFRNSSGDEFLVTTAGKAGYPRQFIIGFQRFGYPGLENFYRKLVCGMTTGKRAVYERR